MWVDPRCTDKCSLRTPRALVSSPCYDFVDACFCLRVCQVQQGEFYSSTPRMRRSKAIVMQRQPRDRLLLNNRLSLILHTGSVSSLDRGRSSKIIGSYRVKEPFERAWVTWSWTPSFLLLAVSFPTAYCIKYHIIPSCSGGGGTPLEAVGHVLNCVSARTGDGNRGTNGSSSPSHRS